MCSIWKKLWRGVVGNPWMVVAVGIWVQSVGGSGNDFGVYSDTMKRELGYDQTTINLLASFKSIGGSVGIVSGFLYDFLPVWVVLATAGILSCAGYLSIWLSITHQIAAPRLWQMCLYTLVAANAQTFSNTAVVVTCIKNFPANRGTVGGLMWGFLGLSGAILLQLYSAIYGNNPASFVLMLSWLMPAVCFASMFIIHPLPVDGTVKETEWRFNLLSVIAIALAFYLFSMIVLQNSITLGRPWVIGICIVLFLIIMLPFWVAIDSERGSETKDEEPSIAEALLYDKNPTGGNSRSHACSSIESDNLGMEGGGVRINEADEPTSNITEGSNKGDRLKPSRGDDFSFLQALQTLDFWLLFVATACSLGTANTLINNMTQLGTSLGYAMSDITTIISLWSIWGFLGRLGAGYLSELCLHRAGIARPAFILLMLVVMSVGHVFVVASFRGSLYIGSTLIGLCYGAQCSLLLISTSELFGLRNFGTLLNTIDIATPLASSLLSINLMGYLYDIEAEKQHGLRHISRFLFLRLRSNVSDSLSCNGSVCFRLTFFIMAAISLFGSVASAVLFYRTRAFYKVQIYQKLHPVE